MVGRYGGDVIFGDRQLLEYGLLSFQPPVEIQRLGMLTAGPHRFDYDGCSGAGSSHVTVP
jgi:hypothetical protein